MAEPENHTLHLLQEFREEFRSLRSDFDAFRAVTEERFGELTKLFAGESVLGRYAAAEVEERLRTSERRVTALEETG
jgi:hypothetical protein